MVWLVAIGTARCDKCLEPCADAALGEKVVSKDRICTHCPEGHTVFQNIVCSVLMANLRTRTMRIVESALKGPMVSMGSVSPVISVKHPIWKELSDVMFVM